MKTFKILAFLLCISFSINSQAQTNDKEILHINYTGDCVSDFLVDMLKKQIPDQVQFVSVLKMMEDYQIHSSYYHNTKTNESVFVLDSISDVPGMSISGYTYYVHRNDEGKVKGKETFMGSDINFTEDVSNIQWEFTDKVKEINGYPCKMAYLKDNQDVYVWFTSEIPVNGGPYVYFGLPGLVLQANSPFESMTATTVTYSSMVEFKEKVDGVKAKENTGKEILLSEVFAKKENFQRMVEAQGE